MPIYEYKCQKCGHALEVMAKVSDPAPAKCERCGAESTMERLVSRTNFQLKGGGWYSDLYSSTKKDGSSESSPAAPGASTPSTSSSDASGSSAASTSTAAPAASSSSGSSSSSSSGSSGSGSSGSGSSGSSST